MIRVLICEGDKASRSRLRHAVENVADELSLQTAEVSLASSAAELEQRVSSRRDGYYDLLICRVDYGGAPALPGEYESPDAVLACLEGLRDGGFDAPLIILASAPGSVARALNLVSASVLPASATFEDFRAAAAPCLKEAAHAREARICLKTREGLSNVTLESILFAESTKRGPLVHMPEGKTVQLPGTLQALFGRLEADGRFVKAGSSFIVNLDNVRSMGERSVIFADGAAIIVPIRVDKPLRESLEGYRAG